MLQLGLTIKEEVQNRFPNLEIRLTHLKNIKISRSDPELEQFKQAVFTEVSDSYSLKKLKDTNSLGSIVTSSGGSESIRRRRDQPPKP